MEYEYKSLRDLDVQPGDVVAHAFGLEETVRDISEPDFCHMTNGSGRYWGVPNWRIVSRASDTPKPWRSMTPKEKGALLLAHHEGKEIEFRNDLDTPNWIAAKPNWADWCYYRVRPGETVTLYWRKGNPAHTIEHGDTHSITFDLIDGEPDCSSIKMEEL